MCVQALEGVHRYLRDRYPNEEHAEMQMTMISQALGPWGPACRCPRVPLHEEGVVDEMMYRLEQILISDSSKPLDDTFRVSVIVTNIPPIRLGGRRKKKAFGPAFREPGAITQNRWLAFMPEFAGRLEDCCLATALHLKSAD